MRFLGLAAADLGLVRRRSRTPMIEQKTYRTPAPWFAAYAIAWFVALSAQIATMAPKTQSWTELLTVSGLWDFALGLPAFFAMIFGARNEFFLTIVSPRWRSGYTAAAWLVYAAHAAFFLRSTRPSVRPVLYAILIALLLFTLAGCHDLLNTVSHIH